MLRRGSGRAQLARRLAEDLLAGAVELAQAAEAGGEGDLGDGQVGVVEQPAGEMHPRRARQPVGRHAHVRDEESAQVPGRDTEPLTQVGLASEVECAVEDQAHRAADQLRRAPREGEGLRPPIRATAMARPVAGGLGGGRERERPHILGAWPRGAAGPAVDTCRDDRRDGCHTAGIPLPEA